MSGESDRSLRRKEEATLNPFQGVGMPGKASRGKVRMGGVKGEGRAKRPPEEGNVLTQNKRGEWAGGTLGPGGGG